MCAHKNLEYSEEFQAVRCKDCNKVWHDKEPVNIINYPIVYPSQPTYIPPQQPYTPSYPTFPSWPTITCRC